MIISINLFLALFVLCFLQSVSSYSSASCPLVNLTSGSVKYSGGGRIVRFLCSRNHVLVGHTSAVCSHGQWMHPTPFCARTNCPFLGRLLHGMVTMTFRGAEAIPVCDPDFTLKGSPSLLCTDNGWNDTLPVCQANSLLQFSICHFEPEEIVQCNWILKPAFFKWIVMSSSEQKPADVGKYPGFDHTLGPHTGGHYLYLENTMPVSSVSLRLEQRVDNGAQYISPLFPGVNDTDYLCLIFFIYSFGEYAGNVKVMIDNDTVWENTELMRRNMWSKVTISLVHQRSPFRIIIIGKGHLGQPSNTAIDDLRIAHGLQCRDSSDNVLPYYVIPWISAEAEGETETLAEDTTSPPIKKEFTTIIGNFTSLLHPDTSVNVQRIPKETVTSAPISATFNFTLPNHTNSSVTAPTTLNTSANAAPIDARDASPVHTVAAVSASSTSAALPSTTAPARAAFNSTEASTSAATTVLTSTTTAALTSIVAAARDFSASTPKTSAATPSSITTAVVSVYSTNSDEISAATAAATDSKFVTMENLQTTLAASHEIDSAHQSSISSMTETSIHNSHSSDPFYVSTVESNSAAISADYRLGMMDFDKSMIYAALVFISIILLIGAAAFKRYRTYHYNMKIENGETTSNPENIAFLNGGVELMNA